MAMSVDIPKRIVLPLDGSDPSFAAAKYAIRLAKMAKKIIFMHAVVNPPYAGYRTLGLMITAYMEEA